MPTDSEGNWVPKMFDRQFEIFSARGRATLVCGPRLSGKTIGALHRIIRHMWETDGARVAMFSRTIKNAKEGGTWMDLHRMIIPEWIRGGIGLRYTTYSSKGNPGPKQTGDSRTPYFRIRNYYGGESELMLFSLDYDDDIDSKMRETRFSMIYFSELSKFKSRKVLSSALTQLRMPHLKYEQHQWISDTNPAEEGDQSWIYNVWYVEKNQTYEEHCKACKKENMFPQPEEEFRRFQRELQLIEIKPEENPFLDPRELSQLRMNSSYDPGIYARDVEGKWVYGEGDSSRHFRSYFKPEIHVVGNADGSDEEKWELLNPSPECFSLITGWDLGETNHAAGIMEKKIIGDVAHFFIIEELVSLNVEMNNEEFTFLFMEKLKALEDFAGREFVMDRNWSDNSSTSRYSATGDTYPYKQVFVASGERIYLEGVPKPHHSIRLRVQLFKQLLHQRRIHISAHCEHVINMCKNVKKGKTDDNYVLREDTGAIHTFSWLTYALLMECAEDLEKLPAVGQRSARRIVQLPLVSAR